MSSAADNFVIEKSYAPQKDRTPFSKKTVIYSNDTNNGQYGSSLNFDLSSFANITNGFINLSDATLQIPIVVTATLPTGQALGTNGASYCLDNFVSWKNGAWNIINSISVSYDGQEVVQPNNFTNAFINYKVMSSWSSDDLKNFGATCLFSPDSSNAWVYNNTDITDTSAGDSRLNQGNGICNNIAFLKTASIPNAITRQDGDYEYANIGAYQRMSQFNHRPNFTANTNTTTGTSQNLSAIRNDTNFNNELQNWTKVFNAANGATNFYQQWYILANIPLKYVSSFFENMPLVKGAYLKMNLTLNTGAVVVNTPVRAANSPAMYCNSSDIYFQYTNPLLICERNAIGGATTNNNATTLVGPKYLLSVGVVQAPSTSVAGFDSHSGKGQSHALNSCRITLPVVELKSAENEAYIKSSLTKYVEWEDIYMTQMQNIKPGNFNYLVSNGTIDPIGILLIPMVASTVNAFVQNQALPTVSTSLANTTFSPALSPFASEPATPSPLSLTQLQVLLGGQNVVSPFLSYTYEEFLYQLNEVYSINGNKATGLGSGLISQADWENLYRYYWITLERGNDSEAKIPRSISVSGYNNNQLAIDILIYVVTKKGFVIDCSTGRIVKDLKAM